MLALLSIALLAVQPAAAANVAQRSASPPALSLLETRMSSHAQLSKIFNEATSNQSAPPLPCATCSDDKMTEGQKLIAADMEAEEDFVRKCQTVVTVSDDKFLPVKPLDRFCQTTDAAMECRLKVGERLKETHARDGDMGKFCLAVYGWFQTKYGSKCPEQCRKLQCKSTCMWLDTQKKLDEDNKDIKAGMDGAKESLKKVKEAGKTVEGKKEEQKKQEFAIKMIDTNIGRAVEDQKEKKEFADTTAKRSKKFDKQVDDLGKKIDVAEASMIKQEDANQKLKFAIDKAKGKLENIERNAVRDMERAKEDRDEEKSLQAESNRLTKEIADLKNEEDGLVQTLKDDKKEKAEQTEVWKKRVTKLQKAMNSLAEYAKDSEKPVTDKYQMPQKFEAEYKRRLDAVEYKSSSEVADFKELMTNQYNRAKDEENVLNEIDNKVTDTEQEISEVKAEKARLTAKKEKADKSAKSAKDKAEALEKRGTDAMNEAKTIKEEQVVKPTAELNKGKDKYAELKAGKLKDEKTLSFADDAAKQENKKLEVAQNDLQSAEQHHEDLKLKKKEAEGKLDDIKRETKEAEEQLKALKTGLATEEKGLTKRIKVYKAAMKDLNKHKPEIVRQHGCAILSNCEKGADALDGGWKNSYP